MKEQMKETFGDEPKKAMYQAEYTNYFEMIFRVDNWIRLVGAVLAIYGKFATPSLMKVEYLGEFMSDTFLIVLGVTVTIFAPDARKILISKFGEKNASNDRTKQSDVS
jgi:hypothetical protein